MSWHPADLFHRRQPRFKYFEPDVWKPYQTLSGKIWILLEKGFSAMFIEGLYIYIFIAGHTATDPSAMGSVVLKACRKFRREDASHE